MNKKEEIKQAIKFVQAAIQIIEDEIAKSPGVPKQAAVDGPSFKELVREDLFGYQRDGAFRKVGAAAAGGVESSDLKEELRQAMYGYRRNEKGEKEA